MIFFTVLLLFIPSPAFLFKSPTLSYNSINLIFLKEINKLNK